jgi:hypothetical protein
MPHARHLFTYTVNARVRFKFRSQFPNFHYRADRISRRMTDQNPSDVLGALPRARPHRRSAKRPARTTETVPDPGGITAQVTPVDGAGQPATPSPKRTPPTPKRSARKAKPTAQSLGSRPQSRASTPARRSSRLTQPAQPAGAPKQPAGARGRHRGDTKAVPKTPAPSRTDLLGTAVGAAAELAEIGLTVGARALRNAVSRLPRP